MNEFSQRGLPAPQEDSGKSFEIAGQESQLVTGQHLNWSITESNRLTLFGQDCCVLDNGKWGFPAILGMLAESEPDPISGNIRECIAQDEADGNGDKIAYIGLSPRYGMILYLEGILTREHLESSMESKDGIVATKINFDDVERGIVISDAFECNLATYDSDGQII